MLLAKRPLISRNAHVSTLDANAIHVFVSLDAVLLVDQDAVIVAGAVTSILALRGIEVRAICHQILFENKTCIHIQYS